MLSSQAQFKYGKGSEKAGTLAVSTLISILLEQCHFEIINFHINNYFRKSLSFKKKPHLKKGSLSHNLSPNSLCQLLKMYISSLFNYSILEGLTFSFRTEKNTNMRLLHSLWLRASFSTSTFYKLSEDGKIY